jgi:hypothetical protein
MHNPVYFPFVIISLSEKQPRGGLDNIFLSAPNMVQSDGSAEILLKPVVSPRFLKLVNLSTGFSLTTAIRLNYYMGQLALLVKVVWLLK